jgi:HSP20 family protein
MFSLMPWRREKVRTALTPRESDPFTLMRREFDNLFDSFFGRWPVLPIEEWDRSAGWGLEMVEEEKEVVVRAEAPGFEPKDFEVRVTDNVLTIIAEHKMEAKPEGEKKEGENKEEKPVYRSYAKLHRAVTLPTHVDAEKVGAMYRNGILELRFPTKPEAEGKRIEVKA